MGLILETQIDFLLPFLDMFRSKYKFLFQPRSHDRDLSSRVLADQKPVCGMQKE